MTYARHIVVYRFFSLYAISPLSPPRQLNQRNETPRMFVRFWVKGNERDENVEIDVTSEPSKVSP
jgi:hypothetical protein